MERPSTENLNAMMRGIELSTYQKMLAFDEFAQLKKYINHLESKPSVSERRESK